VALLVAWWADRFGARPTRIVRLAAWLAPALAIGVASALVWHPYVQPGVLPPPSPATLWLFAPAVAGAIALAWGLHAGRPALLVHGTAAAMVVVLGAGVWPYIAWVNRTFEYPKLAEIVARHSTPAPVGAFFTQELYHAYFYAGRPLHRLASTQEMNQYLARPERPVALINAFNWRFTERVRLPSIAVIDSVWLGTQEILVVRAERPPLPL
jgi:hypothetical protein